MILKETLNDFKTPQSKHTHDTFQRDFELTHDFQVGKLSHMYLVLNKTPAGYKLGTGSLQPALPKDKRETDIIKYKVEKLLVRS